MDPIPESVHAAEELGPFAGTDELLEQLSDMSRRVRDIVPECLGLSLASRRHGLTFTLVASEAEIALLDAAQYLASGPCVESSDGGEVEALDGAAMHRPDWRLFARLGEAFEVGSSLTLPIPGEGVVAGTVNIYARRAGAFDGHHEAIAEVLGAWAEEAVKDADLAFESRLRAQDAPWLLVRSSTVDLAVEVLAEQLGITGRDARARLGEAAVRAGISLDQLAEALLRLRPT